MNFNQIFVQLVGDVVAWSLHSNIYSFYTCCHCAELLSINFRFSHLHTKTPLHATIPENISEYFLVFSKNQNPNWIGKVEGDDITFFWRKSSCLKCRDREISPFRSRRLESLRLICGFSELRHDLFDPDRGRGSSRVV